MRSLVIAPLFAVAGLCFSHVANADQLGSSNKNPKPTAVSSSKNSDKGTSGAAGMFGVPVVFRGTLGDMQIQATVRPKAIAEEGLEGEYFIFGRSHMILLAGEFEGDTIFLEESENGTNISGQWEGKLQGDSIQGIWTSADGAISRPFDLRPLRPRNSSSKVLPVKLPAGAKGRIAADSQVFDAK
jgi:hypothetical protein